DGFTPNVNLTVKEAFDRAAAKVGQRFHDQPLVEAAIRMRIADGYRGLGETRLVVPHRERAVELYNAHLGPDHPQTRDSTHWLALAYQWGGRRPDAIVLFEQILEQRRRTLGPDHADTLHCMQDLAGACEQAGQCPRAELLYKQVWEKRQTILGPTH